MTAPWPAFVVLGLLWLGVILAVLLLARQVEELKAAIRDWLGSPDPRPPIPPPKCDICGKLMGQLGSDKTGAVYICRSSIDDCTGGRVRLPW